MQPKCVSEFAGSVTFLPRAICLASAMLMMRWCVLALISSATALQLGAAPLASRPVVLARRATFSPIMDESSVDETTSLDAPSSRKGLWSGDKEAPECC